MAKPKINSRAKGSSFELKISKALAETAAFRGFSRKDIYRTPLSGGHPFGDRGDLSISRELREYFPFAVECKHYRDWKPGVMLDPREQECQWIAQIRKAAGKEYIPLLIMQGNRTDTFIAAPSEDLHAFSIKPIFGSLLYFEASKPPEQWLLFSFDMFLRMFQERLAAKKKFIIKKGRT